MNFNPKIMKKLLLFTFALAAFQLSFGQLSGVKTIPGDYATVEAAITALNAQGVGAGGVTFNIASGYTELITAPLSVTATGTAANPIIFQKSGAGALPLITAYAGANAPNSAVQDGIWNLAGSDYVTIDGIELVDPNASGNAMMEYGFAFFKADADNGCQYNTIKNCVVTLNRQNFASGSGPSVEGSKAINVINATAAAQTTALTPTSANGTNSFNMFYSNTLQNCNYGIVINGYAAATPFTLGDTGNDIGGSSPTTGNTILNFGGGTGSTNPSAGIRVNNVWDVNISYNTINNNNGAGVNHPSTLRGIYAQAGTSANASINYNNITIKGGGTTSQVAMIENVIGSTAAGNTVNINNNVLTGEYLTATTGVFYGIWSSASAATVNINDNTVSNTNYSAVSLAGSGVNYLLYNSGSATAVNVTDNTVSNHFRTGTTGGTTIGIYVSSGTTQTVSNNSVSNLSIDGTGSTSTLYGIQTSGTTVVANNNIIENLSCIKTTGTSALYGMYNISSPTNENYNDNVIRNLTHNGTGTVYGLYAFTTTGTRTVSLNQIYNITGAGTTIAGINMASSSPNIFKNKIWNIQSTSTGAPTVSGILQGSLGTSGVASIYNNLIGDLRAPAASSTGPTAPSVRGINVTTTSTTTAINISFNSVYLSASSTGANFATAGLYVTTSTTATTAALTLKNNVIVNKSTPAGTGYTVAYQRSSTSLTNFASASNNNLYYAGTPGATRLVFYDGTNLAQGIGDYKALVAPAEGSSFTEDPNFKSLTGTSADFLHINEAIATQIESGGTPVAGITDDFDGQARNGSTPDVGADEFTGIPIDLTPPNIVYTPLSNTSGTGARTLTATITDASGVPTVGTGLPMLYWKINAGAYTGVQAAYLGGNDYSFTFGTGVVLNDEVSYYIVAQDNVAPTPNIGANPSGGAAGFTANPPACSTPPTTPASYVIVGTLSGTYAVGAGQTYPTLTAAIADLNLKDVIGPVTFELWDASYSAGETFPLIVIPYLGEDPSRPVTIKPKAGVTATVTGSSTTGIIVLYGVDYLTIDGSNSGGDDKSLTWENTSTTSSSYTIGVFNSGGNPASNCTIKNCTIKATPQVTNSTYAIILNASGGGYDNIVIHNNTISHARYGIQFAGVAGSVATNGQVTNNIIGSSVDAEAIQYRGIVVSYADNTLIRDNEIMGAPLGNANYSQAGIYMITGSTNTKIHSNNIHDWYYTGTGGWGQYGIYISADATTVTEIINNSIYNIKADGYSASVSSLNPHGIYIGAGGNMKIYHNTINLEGNVLSSSYSSWTGCITALSSVTLLDIRDNILKNSLQPISGSMAHKTYAVLTAGTNTQFTDIDYNNYYVDGISPFIGYMGSDKLTLADWQAATGKDIYSKNINPSFASPSDLHPTNTALDNLGYYLATVPKDQAGITRTNPPDMGALEFGNNPQITTTAASNITCESAVINGTVMANGNTVNTYFDYGLTNAYGSTIAGTPAQVTGNTPVNVTASIASLDPATTYHFRIRVITADNVTSYGGDMMFMTDATAAPTAVTNNASNIGTNSATMNGTVNANCETATVSFEYGTSPAYGTMVTAAESPISGGVLTPVSFDLTGLLTGQVYHYRVVATSTAGTTYGADATFTTGANPPTVVTNPASGIGNFTATLNGTVNANNQLTTVWFEWGLTNGYGSTAPGVPASVSGDVTTPVLANLSGLSYNTSYHFRCVAQNPAGTTYGQDMMFTTACPIPETAGAITGPTALCQSTPGQVYTVAPITYATGYAWTVPTGATIVAGANTNSITVDFGAQAVSGNVSVYGTSVCGNGAASNLAVTVNPLPVPSITGATIGCIGSSYTYTTESGMTGYAWTVSAGGQITAGAGTASVTVQWNSLGSQSISVTYTSAAGCPAAAPAVMPVQVSGLPSPTISGSNMMCANSGLFVYTTEQGFSDYSWTVSTGGTIVSGQGTYQIEVNWTTPGSKTVTVNYDNASGCPAATPASFAVTVMGVPVAPGAITGVDELCMGQNASYSVAPVAGALSYDWTVPAGATIFEGEGTPAIKVFFGPGASSGNITVAAVNNCGNGPASPAFFVTVNPIPPAPVVTVDGDYLLTSSAPDGNQWYFNGNPIEGATGQTHQAEEEGFYWTIVTLNGCSSQESNHVEVIFVGIDELPGTSLNIFPIPNSGKFTVAFVNKTETTYQAEVVNHLGIRIYEKADVVISGQGRLDIDLGNVPKGIYTLTIRTGQSQVMRKIIVTR